jgi:hypothetical protein
MPPLPNTPSWRGSPLKHRDNFTLYEELTKVSEELAARVFYTAYKPRIKDKIKVILCFNYAPCHEGVLEEWMYSSTHSLTSALDGGEWSASRPGRFTFRVNLCYTLDRRLGGPQSRSVRGGKEKNFQPPPEIEP